MQQGPPQFKTTEQAFGEKLHTYTIVDAITGFDATTLNTLWVDKNLRAHGLLQAYSRTNRILDSVKTYGNIVSFRDLEQQTNDAIALFGNKDARGVVLLKPFAVYQTEYSSKVEELLASYPLGVPIVGERAQMELVKLFSEILRLENILTACDDFEEQERLTERQAQDYRSVYLDLYAELDAIIAAEGLRPAETRSFVDNAVRDGAIRATGTEITKCFPRFLGLGATERSHEA